MKKELLSFRVEPMIFLEDKESNFRILPRGLQARFDDNRKYVVMFYPLDGTLEGTGKVYDYIEATPENGILNLTYTFHGEQEYYLRIFRKQDFSLEDTGDRKALVKLSVYSLKQDLFDLRPYRGDFHVHTCRSDGKEAPAVVAANYRKAGFDFLAITDHRRYYPAVEAIDAFQGLPVDLKVFPGEEVHGPLNHVHIVHVGGKWSVNELFQLDEDKFYAEVAQIQKNLQVPDDVNAYEYAACVWAFGKIKEAGGLSIFPHPHWIPCVRHTSGAFTDYLFDQKPFDAYEIIGGNECAQNNTQVALYHEFQATGRKMPIVGSSDSHGTYDGANYYKEESTIVFSRDLELENVLNAVRGFYSVAVEKYYGEQERIYGPFRLVKYAQFLLENYFCIHDEMCFEEGRQMLESQLGGRNALELLRLMQGRTGEFLENCFSNK